MHHLWINDEKVHVILVFLQFLLVCLQWLNHLRIHHNYKCISLAGIGLLLLVVAIFMHDIGGLIGHEEVVTKNMVTKKNMED